MGTRFINTKESAASEDYKKMIMESSAEDIVYTAAVSGVHANFIRASLESVGVHPLDAHHWNSETISV